MVNAKPTESKPAEPTPLSKTITMDFLDKEGYFDKKIAVSDMRS